MTNRIKKEIIIRTDGSLASIGLDSIESQLVACAASNALRLSLVEVIATRLGIPVVSSDQECATEYSSYGQSSTEFSWLDCRCQPRYEVTEENGTEEVLIIKNEFKIDNKGEIFDRISYRVEGKLSLTDRGLVESFIPEERDGLNHRFCQLRIEAIAELLRRLGYNPKMNW
jgi:hypothetical protein